MAEQGAEVQQARLDPYEVSISQNLSGPYSRLDSLLKDMVFVEAGSAAMTVYMYNRWKL